MLSPMIRPAVVLSCLLAAAAAAQGPLWRAAAARTGARAAHLVRMDAAHKRIAHARSLSDSPDIVDAARALEDQLKTP